MCAQSSVDPKLTSLVWTVTNRCNLTCDYCSTSSGPKAEYGHDREEWRHVVDLVAEADVKHVAISGGEPLTRDDLPELVAAIPDDVSFHIDSNGILVREQWSDAFLDANHFSISLDGPAEIHNERRAGHDKVLSNIEWLLDKGLDVGSTITIDDQNVEHLETTIRQLAELGVTKLGVNKVGRFGRNMDGEYSLDEEYTEHVRECEELAKDLGMTVTVNGFYDSYFDLGASESRTDSCYCGVYRANVRFDGSLLPCYALTTDAYYRELSDHYEIPNVNQFDDLSEVHDTELFTDFRRAVTGSPPRGCSGCEHESYCDNGCRAVAWFHGLGLDGPNTHCSIATRQAGIE